MADKNIDLAEALIKFHIDMHINMSAVRRTIELCRKMPSIKEWVLEEINK